MEHNNQKKRFLIKSKKQMFAVIAVFTLMLFVGGTTYAFFNYTRTGAQNTVRTGTINFSSSETGNTVTLNNVFPVSASTIGTASESANDVRTVEVTIDGNTTYNGGIEYVLTLDGVNIETNTTPKKEIPLSLNVTVEGLDSKTIGTPSDDYFTERGTNENPSTTALYSILAKETVKQDEQILVGYIPKNVDVKGKVIVKTYIDANKILITDTPVGNNSEADGYINGTDTTGKTVISTTEWNSLNSSPLSFKVKVEAREGIWVEEVRSVNKMSGFPVEIFGTYNSRTDIAKSIKEVHFNKMGATRMQNAYDIATIKADLTYNNEGKVLAWLETNASDNTKYNLIVASDGDTYLPANCISMFNGWTSVNKIQFNNVNTSLVTQMMAMFSGLTNLEEIDLSMFNGNSLTDGALNYIFAGCTNLREINMHNFNFGNVTDISGLFNNLSNLENLDLSNSGGNNLTSGFGSTSNISILFNGDSSLNTINMNNFNFGNVTDLSRLFSGLSNLENIYMNNVNTSNVTKMTQMFSGCSSITTLDLSSFNTSSLASTNGNYGGYGIFDNCSSLTKIYVSSLWNVSNQPNEMPIFNGCTSLVGTSPNGTTYAYDSSKVDKNMAVIATDTIEGYLTDISLKPTS